MLYRGFTPSAFLTNELKLGFVGIVLVNAENPVTF